MQLAEPAAKHCSAIGKDFCQMSGTPVCPERLKRSFPFQREEPDGREEDSSCGRRVLSVFLDDQPDWLHNRLAAAAEY